MPGCLQLCFMYQFSSVAQSCPTLVTTWIAALQASLSITNSRNSLKLTSIELVMPSSHLIRCRPLLLVPPIPPSIREGLTFPMSQLFSSGDQSTGVPASASVLPKKSQGWSPSEWTGWIRVCYTEWSKSETKRKITYKWFLENQYRWTYFQTD